MRYGCAVTQSLGAALVVHILTRLHEACNSVKLTLQRGMDLLNTHLYCDQLEGIKDCRVPLLYVLLGCTGTDTCQENEEGMNFDDACTILLNHVLAPQFNPNPRPTHVHPRTPTPTHAHPGPTHAHPRPAHVPPTSHPPTPTNTHLRPPTPTHTHP